MKLSIGDSPPVRSTAAVRHETGRWLHTLGDWTHFCTLTFRWNVPLREASRLHRVFLDRLARELAGRRHFLVAGCIEAAGGNFHIHDLLALTGQTVSCQAIGELWRDAAPATGFHLIRPFDRLRGAAWYITKTGSPDVALACPRSKRCRGTSGCVERVNDYARGNTTGENARGDDGAPPGQTFRPTG